MSGEAPDSTTDTLPHDLGESTLDRTAEMPTVEGGEFSEDRAIFSGLKSYIQEIRTGHAANTRARLADEHARRQGFISHVEERLKPIELSMKKRKDPLYKPSRDEFPQPINVPPATSQQERDYRKTVEKRINKAFDTQKILSNNDTALGVDKGAMPFWRTKVARAGVRRANNRALKQGEITDQQHLENAKSVRRHNEWRDSFPQYTYKALLAWRTAKVRRAARQPIRSAIRQMRLDRANIVAGDHAPTRAKYLPPPPQSTEAPEKFPSPPITRHKKGEMLGTPKRPSLRGESMASKIVASPDAVPGKTHRRRHRPARTLGEDALADLAERNMTEDEKANRRPSTEQYKAWEQELTPHHATILEQRAEFVSQLDKLVAAEADRIHNSGIAVTPEALADHLKNAREKFQYQLLRHNLYQILNVDKVPGTSKAEAPLIRKLYDLISMDDSTLKALQGIDSSNILQSENVGFLRILAEDLINKRVEEGADKKSATREVFRQYIWNHFRKSDGSLDEEAYNKFKDAFAARAEEKTTTSDSNNARETGARDFSDLNKEQKEYIARRIQEAEAQGGMSLNDMLNLIYNVRAGFYDQSEPNFFYDEGAATSTDGPQGFQEEDYARANREAEKRRTKMEAGVVSDLQTTYDQLIEQGLSPTKAWAKIVAEQHARNDNPDAGDEEREALRYAAERLKEVRDQARAQKATKAETSPAPNAEAESTEEPTDTEPTEDEMAAQSAQAWAEHEDINPQNATKLKPKKRPTQNRFGGSAPNY